MAWGAQQVKLRAQTYCLLKKITVSFRILKDSHDAGDFQPGYHLVISRESQHTVLNVSTPPCGSLLGAVANILRKQRPSHLTHTPPLFTLPSKLRVKRCVIHHTALQTSNSHCYFPNKVIADSETLVLHIKEGVGFIHKMIEGQTSFLLEALRKGLLSPVQNTINLIVMVAQICNNSIHETEIWVLCELQTSLDYSQLQASLGYNVRHCLKSEPTETINYAVPVLKTMCCCQIHPQTGQLKRIESQIQIQMPTGI